MAQLIVIHIICACGCGGPRNSLKVDIDSSHAIFIGIITKINRAHLFHLDNQLGTGLKFINFDILKTHKGINEAQLKVTLFDSASNSSCEGIIYGKSLGDTVLVFADEFNWQMLGSYICGRHPAFQYLSPEEMTFIDTAKWVNPRIYYKDPAASLKERFPEQADQINQSKEPENKGKFNLFLYLSLGLNVIFGWLLLKKYKG